MPAPTVLPQPASTADWTVGNGSFGSVTIEPTSGKKTTGWTPAERPSPQFMNWLFYNQDQWVKFLNSLGSNHDYRIALLEAEEAALGQATNISAANAGHTTATGTNVQVQLDEIDAALKDIYNAVTTGKGIDLVGYEAAADANWSPVPENAGSALDQLATRVHTIEQTAGGQDYIQASLCDYVVPADKSVTGFPGGVGNPGLVDTNLTNPRGIKISELQTVWGEERIYFHAIKETGNYDSAGRPEWAVVAPKHDVRVMLYGNWKNTVSDTTEEGLSYSLGQFVSTADPNAYILVTGVCDGLAMMAQVTQNNSNQIQVDVDGVNTTALSQRGSIVLENAHCNIDQMISDTFAIFRMSEAATIPSSGRWRWRCRPAPNTGNE